MRGEILEADGQNLARWAEFLEHHPGAGLFCQPLWLNFLAEVYGFPVRLAVCTANGRILAGTPLVETQSLLFGRRLSNNPFSLYGELPAENPEAAGLAAKAAVDLATRLDVRSLALRLAPLNARPVGTPPLPENAAGLTALQNRVIPLLHLGADYEQTFLGYRKQFRTNLRKARQQVEEGGFRIEMTTDAAGYRRFYPVLLRLFRDKHAMFPAPLAHFLALAELLGPGHARLYTLLRGGRAVAGMVILLYGGRAYYSWSAALPESDAVDGGAVLLDRVVQDLCALGLRELDMGVSSPSSTALLFFKGRFGAEMTRPWHYHFSPSGRPLSDMSAETSLKGPRAVLKALPLPLFGALGRMLYRHMA